MIRRQNTEKAANVRVLCLKQVNVLRLEIFLEGAKVAVQGFGNVGSIAAELMSQAHARVVAVQDHSGSLGNAAGIDVASLIRHVQETGGIAGFAEAEAMDEEAFWGVDCDVMIPAALEGQVDGPRAQRIRASLLVEGANGPVNREADQILLERGVTVVPDVIANAGGVVVSYFEWVQDFSSFFWSEDEINLRLEAIQLGAFREIQQRALALKVPLRTAAYVIACQRVLQAREERGLYP